MSIDRYLPDWARRTHPFVRHYLGTDWRLPPFETDALRRIFAAQVLLTALTIFVPFLKSVNFSWLNVALIPAIIAGFAHLLAASLILPVIYVIYAWILFRVGLDSARIVVAERDGSTFDLLRTTPPSTQRQFLFMISACIWRRSGLLNAVMVMTAALSLPILVIQYSSMMPLGQTILLPQLGVASGLTASLIRLWLEPLLAGALGILCGSIAVQRISAQIAATVLLASYLLLINALRIPPMSIPVRVFIETVLPILLPVALSTACLYASAYVFENGN